MAMPVVAQQTDKHITTQELAWLAYKATWRFDQRWSANMDVQERVTINPVAQHLAGARATLTRTLGAGWDLGAGLCLFLQSPNDPYAPSDLIVPELRPHVELAAKQKMRYFHMVQRYKAEARWFHNVENGALAPGYAFGNFRLRYRIGLDVPLLKATSGDQEWLGCSISNELMVNAGKRITYNVFDQNRAYLGFYANVCPNLTVELGYLNAFQQRPSGHDFHDLHIVRLGVNQKLGRAKNPATPTAG